MPSPGTCPFGNDGARSFRSCRGPGQYFALHAELRPTKARERRGDDLVGVVAWRKVTLKEHSDGDPELCGRHDVTPHSVNPWRA